MHCVDRKTDQNSLREKGSTHFLKGWSKRIINPKNHPFSKRIACDLDPVKNDVIIKCMIYRLKTCWLTFTRKADVQKRENSWDFQNYMLIIVRIVQPVIFRLHRLTWHEWSTLYSTLQISSKQKWQIPLKYQFLERRSSLSALAHLECTREAGTS